MANQQKLLPGSMTLNRALQNREKVKRARPASREGPYKVNFPTNSVQTRSQRSASRRRPIATDALCDVVHCTDLTVHFALRCSCVACR
jgi:hypothetical protein